MARVKLVSSTKANARPDAPVAARTQADASLQLRFRSVPPGGRTRRYAVYGSKAKSAGRGTSPLRWLARQLVPVPTAAHEADSTRPVRSVRPWLPSERVPVPTAAHEAETNAYVYSPRARFSGLKIRRTNGNVDLPLEVERDRLERRTRRPPRSPVAGFTLVNNTERVMFISS